MTAATRTPGRPIMPTDPGSSILAVTGLPVRRPAGMAAALVLAAIVLIGGACTTSHPVTRAVAPRPAAVAAPPVQPVAPEAEQPPPVPVPAPRPPVLVADANITSVGVFPAPGAPASGTLANPNPLGRPLVFLVRQQQDGWLQVQLPERPNGTTGWIQAADVTLRPDPYRITVELCAHRLTAYQADTPL